MAIQIADLTTEDKDQGTGSFDVLMRATKEHLAAEYTQGRIRGAEYAEVYLGSVQQVMERALQFLLERDRLNAQLELLALEKDKMAIEVERAAIEKEIAAAQKLKIDAEVLLANAQVQKVNAEVVLVEAEVALKQANKPKIDAEVGLITAQTSKTDKETLQTVEQTNLIISEKLLTNAKTGQIAVQNTNIAAETALTNKRGDMVIQEIVNLEKEVEKITAEIVSMGYADSLVQEKTTTEIKQQAVLVAQECKLKAEFDLIMKQIPKVEAETGLLAQKKATETAEITDVTEGVKGAQIALYKEQAWGFKQDAKQKAAKVMVDTYNIRRTTDSEASPPLGLTDDKITNMVNSMTTDLIDV